MNRSIWFDYIVEKLNLLAARIEAMGKLNLLHLHMHSEDFYMHFLNLLYGWHLVNHNEFNHNAESIDLIDEQSKLIVQVTATCTKHKVESSLNKETLSGYKGYKFKFIFISKDATNLRNQIFNNPYDVNFIPEEDILDRSLLLRRIRSVDIDKLRDIYDFIKKELGETDVVKLDSNLATIIDILSKEDLVTNNRDDNKLNAFEIQRKIEFNMLNKSRDVIDDYKIHQGKLNKKYQEFDKQGVNKSYTVLQNIKSIYIQSTRETDNADIIFFNVIDKVKELVINSRNYSDIPVEELDLCINILVVDAFIRCKIFKNPEGYTYASI